MSRPTFNREDALARMGAHVLSHGLNTASLRPLAKAAGTSDRMLVYHFGSKDALLAELLQSLAMDLAQKLEKALPANEATSTGAAMRDIVALLRTQPFSDYMRVWLDIVSSASQGNDMHRQTGSAMIEGFYDWLKSRLPAGTPDPEIAARSMLTLTEGIMVLDAVDQSEAANLAIDYLFPIDDGTTTG